MTCPELNYSNHSEKSKKGTFVKSFIIILILLFAVVVFSFGRSVGRREGQLTVVTETNNEEYGKVEDKGQTLPDFFKRDVNFSVYWKVWNKIQSEFIDRPIPEPQLFYGSLVGLVASLGDPYSVFLEPKISHEFQEELQGRFEGIGCEIGIRDSRLVAVSPLPDSPAEKAGLKAGDKIFFIDDHDTTGISIEEAVSRIRGEKGSQVVLTIVRDNETDYRKIAITRDTIKIVSVSWKIHERNNKKIAVIELTHFNSDTNLRLVEAINEILLSNPDGLILDVRGNPGGYIDQAVDVASHWVANGQIVVTEDYGGGQKNKHLASGSAELKEYKTIVLINRGSASASEIVAGALQDYNLAKILGEQSFGKGSVQSLQEFEDGSSVKLTVARWITPNNHQIDNQGITPDEQVELTEEDWNLGIDPQMERAINILSGAQ
ncbi:MAG: S41 family peptidase [Patescibacteria group bacterium]